jgi:general stress protein 26
MERLIDDFERSHAMSDLKERIYEILRKPQLSGLATITQDGKPWVRYVMTAISDDLTIRCATFVHARKVKQIEKNAEVHLTCGVTDPQKMAPYLQIQGRAALDTGKEARHGFWSDMLAPIFDGPDDPNYGVLVITPYCIEYCSVGSHEPEVWTAE